MLRLSLMRSSLPLVQRLAPFAVCATLLSTPAVFAQTEPGYVIGPMLQLVARPGETGPTTPVLGVEAGYVWLFKNRVQLRLGGRFAGMGEHLSNSGGAGEPENPEEDGATAATFTRNWTVAFDVGARIAGGKFDQPGTFYGFIYPGFFSRHLWRFNNVSSESHLNEVGIELGGGYSWQVDRAKNTRADLGLTFFHLHQDPQSGGIRVSFYPAVAVAIPL